MADAAVSSDGAPTVAPANLTPMKAGWYPNPNNAKSVSKTEAAGMATPNSYLTKPNIDTNSTFQLSLIHI